MKLHHGDCVEILPTLEPDSVDAVVTDPPYELAFMGKQWDGTGVAFQPQTWAEVLRVAKPGAHMVAFGGTRTFHRMTCAIEDAGWQIRDCLMWLYGSGFPKSQNISKAIDRAAGAQRETVRMPATKMQHSIFGDDNARPYKEAAKVNGFHELAGSVPATPEAQQWDGWGTALKPAWEPIILARKPLSGTVAGNVLAYGTGGLHIDAARIPYVNDADTPTQEQWNRMGSSGKVGANGYAGQISQGMKDAYRDGLIPVPKGRWPANVALDETAAEMLDQQTGELSFHPAGQFATSKSNTGTIYGNGSGISKEGTPIFGYGDHGGASRFYYTSKAPAEERRRINGIAHPTVKPLDLIQWLLKLICPRGGTVLDPFAGSGTTGEAAMLEGMQAVLIEREADYLPLILQRSEWFKS